MTIGEAVGFVWIGLALGACSGGDGDAGGTSKDGGTDTDTGTTPDTTGPSTFLPDLPPYGYVSLCTDAVYVDYGDGGALRDEEVTVVAVGVKDDANAPEARCDYSSSYLRFEDSSGEEFVVGWTVVTGTDADISPVLNAAEGDTLIVTYVKDGGYYNPLDLFSVYDDKGMLIMALGDVAEVQSGDISPLVVEAEEDPYTSGALNECSDADVFRLRFSLYPENVLLEPGQAGIVTGDEVELVVRNLRAVDLISNGECTDDLWGRHLHWGAWRTDL